MVDPALEAFSASVKLVRSSRRSDECPWCNGFDYQAPSTSLCLHRELIDFAKWMGPTPEERHLRMLVIHRFRNAIRALWPDAITVCHGSSATATYLPSGDIDFVVCRESTDTPIDVQLMQLNEHLISMQVFRKSEVIGQAKTPIIKGVEKPFGFKIDLAIDNENGVLNVERNRKLMQTYPAIYPLLMFLKFFLFQYRLDEPFHGGLSTNTLQNLILFILQSTPADGRLHLGKLMLSFFKTFGKSFNYITTGISVREGGRLFSRIEQSRVNWAAPVRLSVEDPQNPGQFLGENGFECMRFRDRCDHAYDRLMAENQPPGSMLLRVIQRPDWIIHRRQELMDHYRVLLGNASECVSLARPRLTERNDRGDDTRRFRDPPPYARRPPSRPRYRSYENGL
jgi:non-canonical poly(A) RNA polymerase PAPD5/7